MKTINKLFITVRSEALANTRKSLGGCYTTWRIGTRWLSLLVTSLVFLSSCAQQDPVFANPDLYELTGQVQELQKHVDQLAVVVLQQQKEIKKLQAEDVYINEVVQQTGKK